MFTGIVEELGRVIQVETRTAGARLRIGCSKVLESTQVGASVSVNGVCLTAIDPDAHSFAADLAPETLKRTNLGDLRAGSIVNLERPLLASGRLDGHVVQGHVDGTGSFVAMDALGDENWWMQIRIPAELDRYVVFKGSIAVDGVSLTVASIEAGIAAFTVIPHTYRNTVLGQRQPGDRVNLECDVFAKYLEKMVAGRLAVPASS